MLLVNRRGNDQLTVDVADDAAREDVGVRKGVAVADGEDFIADPEDRHLLAGDERADAGAREDVFEAADFHAGIGWPRSLTNATPLSGSSLFTEWRKRARIFGVSIAIFHSQAYVSTWRCMSASSSAPMPSESSQTTLRT